MSRLPRDRRSMAHRRRPEPPPPETMSGPQLRRLRLSLGLTLEELARECARLGVSYSQARLSVIERERRIPEPLRRAVLALPRLREELDPYAAQVVESERRAPGGVCYHTDSA